MDKLELRATIKILEKAGWERYASILADDKASCGIAFIRKGERFLLNSSTVNNLPV